MANLGEARSRHPARTGRSTRRVRVAALAALSLSLGLASAAVAQESPYHSVEQQASQNDLDTDLTPVAKETDLWTLVEGAKYPQTKTIEGSVTSFDSDLFDVSFGSLTIGLAGGSACPKAPVQQAGESDTALGARVAECETPDGTKSERVPVLYRYTAPKDGDPRWERIPLPGSNSSGYIGAIAWIDPERALIVGGTGVYPRRELGPNDTDQYGRSNSVCGEDEDPHPCEVTDPDKADVAGKARAWLYTRESDSVQELDLSTLTAGELHRAGMRGLSAVGCYRDPSPGLRWRWDPQGWEKDPIPDVELCYAGALGQLWEWRYGRFTGKRIDHQSPIDHLDSAGGTERLRFRVRHIAFQPEVISPPQPYRAVAITSGCCTADAQLDLPRRLAYNGDTDRWQSARMYGPEAQLPDSAYSMLSDGAAKGMIVSPGGPEQTSERPSVVSPADAAQNAPRTPLGTARLVAGDGDVATSDTRRLSTFNALGPIAPRSGPDGIPDWTAGELRSTRVGELGARGLLFATALPPTAQDSINEGRGTAPPSQDEVAGGEYEPFDQEKFAAHVRSRHYLLPSYSVNSVEIVGAQQDGWMVGDHGAILRLSSAALADAEGANEPAPPQLGQPRSAPLSERDSYEGVRPGVASHAGIVPPIGAETEPLAEPQLVNMGELDSWSVVALIMSPDGSEGWILGNDSGGATFAHYDGIRWSVCDPVGVPGVVPPDPACAAMAPLRGWRDPGGTLQTVRITGAARVPLENDGDPTNDDELEIVAQGTPYRGPETDGKTISALIRYSDGRWRFADPDFAEGFPYYSGDFFEGNGFVFTAPDSVWALRRYQPTTGLFRDQLLHWNGKRWINCMSEPGPCGNVAGPGSSERRLRDFLPGQTDAAGEAAGLVTAGERVYLYGSRKVGSVTGFSSLEGNTVLNSPRHVPMILYHDPGGTWTDGSAPGEDGGGFDPAYANPGTDRAGRVQSLSVVETPDGEYEGWAVGNFGRGADTDQTVQVSPPPLTALMRLDTAAGGGWRPYASPGPVDDYMRNELIARLPSSAPRLQVTYPSGVAPGGSFIGQIFRSLPDLPAVTSGWSTGNRIFGFDPERERFGLVDAARPATGYLSVGHSVPRGEPAAMAPDGEGRFWVVAGNSIFHYTDRAPAPVFEDVPDPAGIAGVEPVAIDGGPDGSVWMATDSDRVYRYDRLGGWEEIRVPGWEPGRVVVRAASATAIAVGPGGEGVLVGEGGRIAELSPEAVRLDPAAGRSCALGDPQPCSTGRDLLAVDIAPDGSAIAAGERLALLWRPPGGEFQSIATPRITSSTRITDVVFPAAERAYLATDSGIVFRGTMATPGEWRWQMDNTDRDGNILTANEQGAPLSIADMAIEADGHGYAIGDGLFERSPEGEWRRLPYRGTSVGLPAGDGNGVLIGASSGSILTGAGTSFVPARYPEPASSSGPVIGFAYLPGSTEGTVDAWALVGPNAASNGDARLLRYRSDAADPSLAHAASAQPLPDAPAHREGELAIGAFGKSDCDRGEWQLCPEMSATTTTNELILERIIDELVERREAGALDLALLSGDATDSAGRPTSSLGDYDELGVNPGHKHELTWMGQLKHRRFAELIADELEDRGVPFFGALGSQDLTENFHCDPGFGDCGSTKQFAAAGENYAWREAFDGRAEPWGDGSRTSVYEKGEEGVEIVPAQGSEATAVRVEDQRIEDPTGGEGVELDTGAEVDLGDPDGAGTVPQLHAAPRASVPPPGETRTQIGGAATHYALDAVRDGEPIARIVFVDTSLGSLAASDPLQQPVEAAGQQRFLERMLCVENDPSASIDGCTREEGQAAVVVSNTPTYSYGPGALTRTAADATTFEATMLRYGVDLVISGALGFNGLYYTFAPGVHEPCPGGEHPKAPPKGLPSCASGAEPASAELSEHGVPDPQRLLEGQGLSGAVPTLIASGAGGKFGPDGIMEADGAEGRWHGYSVARLMPDGEVVVEQRPILDWVGIRAEDHVVDPRERLSLRGFARSPLSNAMTVSTRAYHYEISTAAITHRYDLLLADPEEPWLACEASDAECVGLYERLAGTRSLGSARDDMGGACEPYLCLPANVGSVDRISGEVRAGNGKYPETFAIAMLSVDDKAATWPLYFKRSPSFVVNPASIAPAIPSAPPGSGSTPPPPAPPNPAQPNVPQPIAPQTPALPGVPPLSAAAPPEPQPPAPPVPPPPTEQPSPLSLTLAPPGIAIATPTAVIQPPTPPVNPAPPGGARREARQRQAAAQKSGADSDQESSETQDMGGDLAQSPLAGDGSSSFVRRDRVRAGASFTPIARADQPSAWTTGLLYGGGVTLMAFVAAMGWTWGRPTPRRRAPEIPAPAYARTRQRRVR